MSTDRHLPTEQLTQDLDTAMEAAITYNNEVGRLRRSISERLLEMQKTMGERCDDVAIGYIAATTELLEWMRS